MEVAGTKVRAQQGFFPMAPLIHLLEASALSTQYGGRGTVTVATREQPGCIEEERGQDALTVFPASLCCSLTTGTAGKAEWRPLHLLLGSLWGAVNHGDSPPPHLPSPLLDIREVEISPSPKISVPVPCL
ncbi:unnamed protein product [Rangifer tarandus platyrhynchus]|uniref:Uncharacterized protein n=2 Tax=Rangifer tarandus platyrhynchus TaxID=3082113 RepID=A0AC59ZSP5_RANTA|nr:unnamed protein product [Rangifer tarandus platyrhynchus]